MGAGLLFSVQKTNSVTVSDPPYTFAREEVVRNSLKMRLHSLLVVLYEVVCELRVVVEECELVCLFLDAVVLLDEVVVT